LNKDAVSYLARLDATRLEERVNNEKKKKTGDNRRNTGLMFSGRERRRAKPNRKTRNTLRMSGQDLIRGGSRKEETDHH